MGGQHELDANRSGRPVERAGGNARGEQTRARVFARAALRAPASVARVLAAAAHAMMLLRDVGQRQEMGERARDAKRRVDGQLAQQSRELVEVVVIARVR